MEARELRIGNLVYREAMFDGGVIETITGYDLWHSEKLDEVNHKVEWESLKPIPLTEEWLLKFGFEKVSNSPAPNFSYQRSNVKVVDFEYKATGDYFRGWLVPTYGEKDFCMNGNFAEIKFVHQLQNLYCALTNTELTINL